MGRDILTLRVDTTISVLRIILLRYLWSFGRSSDRGLVPHSAYAALCFSLGVSLVRKTDCCAGLLVRAPECSRRDL